MKLVKSAAVTATCSVFAGLLTLATPAGGSSDDTTAPAIPGVENLLRLSDRILSGSEPIEDETFAALKRLGVRTIVSVDGIRPDIERARRHGLRYVHIPFGYDGIPQHAAYSLTAVVRETSGPVYLHCHHGKHRGPAAAAIACRAEGSADAKRAREILAEAGTSRDYSGLWRDVEAFVPPPRQIELPDLTEVADVETLASGMAKLSRRIDTLGQCRTNHWGRSDDHPDIVPAREALQARELIREMQRMLPADTDEQLLELFAHTDQLAEKLVQSLRKEETDTADESFRKLNESCRRCHVEFRD